jgi:HEAT repeat protein
MLVQSRAQWLCFIALAIGALALTTDARLAAQTRQVSVESLIYDLKSPDPVRRQAAAKELGAVKYQAATPDLVPLAHDPVDAVRREVELALERMEDMRALPGFVELSTDMQDDIRARAVASLVNLHLPRTNGIGAVLTRLGDLIMLAPTSDLDLIIEPDVPVDPVVIAALRGRVVDPERGIRKTAIRGLGILRAGPAVPDLVQSQQRHRPQRADGDAWFDAPPRRRPRIDPHRRTGTANRRAARGGARRAGRYRRSLVGAVVRAAQGG